MFHLYFAPGNDNKRSLTLFQIIPYQTGYLAGIGVAMGGQLGIEQFSVDGKLEAASIGRYQGERIEVGLKLLEQFGCQTDSTIGVVSDCTIDQLNFQHAHISYAIKSHPRR